MKQKRGLEIKIKLSNRWLYTFIILGILAIIGVGVYAYGTSDPSVFGHSLGEIEPCADGEILQVSEGAWSCVAMSSGSLWTQSGSNIYYTNGNVGIGTSDFGTLNGLHLGAGKGLKIGTDSTGGAYIRQFQNGGIGYLKFYLGDVREGVSLSTDEVLVLDSLGKVEVKGDLGVEGLVDAYNGLYTSQDFSGTGNAAYFPYGLYVPSTSTTSWIYSDLIYLGFTSGDTINFRGNTITGTGSVTAGSFLYSSDESLKENIQIISDALEKVQLLEGVSFNWKSNGEESIGLIAQDVEKVLPEIVSTDKNGLKSVEYGNLVALLIEAVKEQQKEIDELKFQLEE